MVASAPPSELVCAITSTNVVTVRLTDEVGKALQTMARRKMGSIVAVEKRILTERDVLMRTAEGQNVRSMVVRNVMSKPLVTILPSAEVDCGTDGEEGHCTPSIRHTYCRKQLTTGLDIPISSHMSLWKKKSSWQARKREKIGPCAKSRRMHHPHKLEGWRSRIRSWTRFRGTTPVSHRTIHH